MQKLYKYHVIECYLKDTLRYLDIPDSPICEKHYQFIPKKPHSRQINKRAGLFSAVVDEKAARIWLLVVTFFHRL